MHYDYDNCNSFASGNPPLGNQMQLFSQNGYDLTVRPDGTILGTDSGNDTDSHLELSNAGDVACIRIKSVNHDLYVCFSPEGILYGEQDPENPGTVFKENLEGNYSVYRSMAYPDWYIGIKKSGESKPGPKTCGGQRAVKFLPRNRQFQ